MASRPELIECCKELGIKYHGMKIADMEKAVRVKADELFMDKQFKVSADHLSETLKHFLTTEYDYKIFDKDGEIQTF